MLCKYRTATLTLRLVNYLERGVPGQLRGLDRILKRYGTMDWPTVSAPAIEVADKGFTFGHDMEWMVNWTLTKGPIWNASQPNFFVQNAAWQPDFAPKGRPVKRNETIHRKRYAETLRTIARTNTSDFYTGGIAKNMVSTIKANGGNMTMKDLRDYSIVHRKPRQISYRGYNVTSTVSPSSGTVLLNILSVLNNYHDFFKAKNTTGLSTHRMVEAIKFGYAYVCGLPHYSGYHINIHTAELFWGPRLHPKHYHAGGYHVIL